MKDNSMLWVLLLGGGALAWYLYTRNQQTAPESIFLVPNYGPATSGAQQIMLPPANSMISYPPAGTPLPAMPPLPAQGPQPATPAQPVTFHCPPNADCMTPLLATGMFTSNDPAGGPVLQ